MTVQPNAFGVACADPPPRHRRSVVPPAMIPGLVLLVDVLAIALAGSASWAMLPAVGPGRGGAYVFCIALICVTTPLLMARSGLYEVEAIMRPLARTDSVVMALGTAFLLFLTIAFSLKASEVYSRLWIYCFGAGATALVIAARVGVCRLAVMLSRSGVIRRNVVVFGAGEQARQFLRRAGLARLPFARFAGVFAPERVPLESALEGHPVIGGRDALIEAARRGAIDDVVVALPWQEDARLRDTFAALRELPVDVYISTDLIGYRMPLRPALGEFHRLPLFEVVRQPIAGWNRVVKRAADLVLGSAFLLLLAPLMALVALAIRLESPGPVLFRQQRLGFNNGEFEILKFRSMHHRPAAPGPDFEPQATPGDPRVTRVGRIIRRTSIDELPQLVCVLQGTMSLVGPRPHALGHNAEYARRIRGYFARHKVKPGMTGWAQVKGLRGQTAELSLMQERVEHDTYYAENWSVLFDLRILLMTVFLVLFQKRAC